MGIEGIELIGFLVPTPAQGYGKVARDDKSLASLPALSTLGQRVAEPRVGREVEGQTQSYMEGSLEGSRIRWS